jgi:alcohol dehydrogenase YqhD (iron-dependent ADH family)
MQNFRFHAPTEILFGTNQVENLPSLIKPYGKTVLLAYGGGSIKRNGIYDQVKKVFSDFTIIDFENIEPNPRLDSVKRGIALAKEHKVDVILAVGGGSVIDCAKVVAAGYYYDGDAWDIVADSSKITNALPLFSVLTLAGTGSEMNRGAVITNTKLNLKQGTGHPSMAPKASVIDPNYLMSLPAYQTAAGSVDIFSHILENYFKAEKNAFVNDRIAEGILKTVIEFAPIAIEDPKNYNARANLAWASSLALNGITGSGKPGAWAVHPIEHEISAYYDLTHGVGLAILTPVWMRYTINDTNLNKYVEYGINVFNIDSTLPKYEIAEKAIDATEIFFTSLNIPMKLSEVDVDETHFKAMAKSAVKLGRLDLTAVPLDEEDVLEILKKSL